MGDAECAGSGWQLKIMSESQMATDYTDFTDKACKKENPCNR